MGLFWLLVPCLPSCWFRVFFYVMNIFYCFGFGNPKRYKCNFLMFLEYGTNSLGRTKEHWFVFIYVMGDIVGIFFKKDHKYIPKTKYSRLLVTGMKTTKATWLLKEMRTNTN